MIAAGYHLNALIDTTLAGNAVDQPMLARYAAGPRWCRGPKLRVATLAHVQR
jgi:hypothetical protein